MSNLSSGKATYNFRIEACDNSRTTLRACLNGVGGPHVKEVTSSAIFVHTILQPRDSGVKFLEVVSAIANVT